MTARFRSVGPRGPALTAVLAGRAEPRVPGVRRAVLNIDTDVAGRMRLEKPSQGVPWQHGRYIRGDTTVEYYRFYVRGVAFERRCESELVGNFPVVFATIQGVRYLLQGGT